MHILLVAGAALCMHPATVTLGVVLMAAAIVSAYVEILR